MDGMTNVEREPPPQQDGEATLVGQALERIAESKRHWSDKFKRMKRDSDFARGKQWPNQTADDDRYVANLVQRHIGQRTSALYAKNPRFIATRRKQADFQLWDGSFEQMQQAMMAVQSYMPMAEQDAMLGASPPVMIQQAQMLLQDIAEGNANRKMLDKVGKTTEILMQYQVQEQFPPFKTQMKALVRRTLTTSVGWVKLGFERHMSPRPEDVEKTRDLTQRMAVLQSDMADVQDDVVRSDMEAQKVALQQQLDLLQSNPQQIVREGLVFDFPQSDKIIVDKRCRQLHGFVGARWIAQEFQLTAGEIQQIYGKDIKALGFTPYTEGGVTAARGDLSRSHASSSEISDESIACVYEVYDKTTGHCYTVADGCKYYMRAPAVPEIALDRFWPFFVLTFNDIEHEKEIYPPSDPELMFHMQMEHNRSREGKRQHRQAAAPAYATGRGTLTEGDKDKLISQEPHEVVELDGMAPGQKVGDILQRIEKAGVDPNLYDTNETFDDVLKVMGTQEAVLGGTSGSTATEVSVGEGSRMSSVASNVDDLDDLFNEIARASSQILFAEFSDETVKKICGRGAVWPTLSAQQIADELFLEVEAGSSGRPNRAVDIKNFTDLSPILMQIPGVRPEWLAKQGIQRLDDRLDLEDAFLAGMPSVMAANRMAQQNVQADPAANPNEQGGEGGDNAKRPPSGSPQPNMQPAPGGAPVNGQTITPSM
jgi:hypothetical protein